MDFKKGLLVFLILAVLGVILFNLNYLGFSTVNTTSNLSIVNPHSYPFFQQVNSSLFTCEGDRFYYEFNATDLDGNSLSGSISPRDPFFIFWISQQSVNTTFAIVSGTLSKADAGGVNAGSKLYQENITVNDGFSGTCCSNSTTTNITVIEKNNAPSIEDVGVKTIWNKGQNSTLYEEVDVNDTEYDSGYGTLNFNVSIVNATNGSSVSLFNITSPGGVINFTANLSTALGVYNVTVCVNDTGLTNAHANISAYCGQTGASITRCDNFSLTITDSNRAPNITDYYPSTLNFSAQGTTNLYFNITTNDPDGTIPDAYWLVDGVQEEYDSSSNFNEFNHTFGCGVSGYHIVFVNVTDGLLNTSLTWNVSVEGVSCAVPGGGGGGGGGGAPISNVNFKVEPEFLTATIFKEEGKSFDIKITNLATTEANITTEVINLSEVIILNEENFVLKVGEAKTIRLYLYALSSTKPGIYFGKVIFKSGGIERRVNIVLEVKEKEALFDIKVTVPREFKSVNAGQNVKALVDMLNVGLYGTAVDVELFLYIANFDKLIIYENSKEIIAVKTNLSVERQLFVPIDTSSGPYLLIGEAKYGNITVSTYDTFNVVEKKYLRASYVLLIIVIIILLLFILFLLWKRRKKKDERQQ